MITNQEVKALDINADYFGIPQASLMEEAGKQSAYFIKKNYPNHTCLIICGKGNNGGDGFVAARYLSDTHKTMVYLIGRETDIQTDIAQKNFQKLKDSPISIFGSDSKEPLESHLQDATLIIDAMLGVGLTGTLKEPYQTIVKHINASGKPIISLDIPTGLGTTTSIKPKHTLTFHDAKPQMTPETCGSIHIIDIGIPSDITQKIGPGDLSIYYPRPKKTSHKGENGRVLIIGGGMYTGAPALSALAALRTGADLTYIVAPQHAASIIATYSPNLIVQPLFSTDFIREDDTNEIVKLYEKIDAILIGPGLGRTYETMEAIRVLIQETVSQKKPLVIDADALHAVNKHHDIFRNSTTVITPHAYEFHSLTGEIVPNDLRERKTLIENWAQKLGITILLKGEQDIISNGEQIRINTIHNEAMTVGGTGDVLAGITAAFLAKGVSPWNAARMAAFLNGQAGNNAFNIQSYGLVATDIINEIPKVIHNYV